MSSVDHRAKSSSGRGRALHLLALALLLAAPLFLSGYFQGIVAEILIFAMFAMSLDLLLGYTGLASFGHALFFGIGAYAVVILGVHHDVSPYLGILAGVGAALALASVVGFLCVRSGGIIFLMLTMAFSQLFYSVALKWRSVTGGSDGLGGLERPSLFGLDLTDPLIFYYAVLAIFVAVYWGLRRLVLSPLGRAFVGIRENEDRMRSIGFPTFKYKLASFIIAGGIAGLAGGVYGVYTGFVSSDLLFWTRSGDVLIMTILGGAGTLVGPAIGAGFFLLARNYVSSMTDHWIMLVGIIFLLCVLFLKRGIFGAVAEAYRERVSK